MIRRLSIFLIFAAVGVVEANTKLLVCNFESKDWLGEYSLDAIGNASLQLYLNSSQKTYKCNLKLDYLDDAQQAVVPSIIVLLDKINCNFKETEFDQKILLQHVVIINLMNKNSPFVRLQWHKNRQPEECKIKTLNIPEISISAQKWLKGKL